LLCARSSAGNNLKSDIKVNNILRGQAALPDLKSLLSSLKINSGNAQDKVKKSR